MIERAPDRILTGFYWVLLGFSLCVCVCVRVGPAKVGGRDTEARHALWVALRWVELRWGRGGGKRNRGPCRGNEMGFLRRVASTVSRRPEPLADARTPAIAPVFVAGIVPLLLVFVNAFVCVCLCPRLCVCVCVWVCARGKWRRRRQRRARRRRASAASPSAPTSPDSVSICTPARCARVSSSAKWTPARRRRRPASCPAIASSKSTASTSPTKTTNRYAPPPTSCSFHCPPSICFSCSFLFFSRRVCVCVCVCVFCFHCCWCCCCCCWSGGRPGPTFLSLAIVFSQLPPQKNCSFSRICLIWIG